MKIQIKKYPLYLKIGCLEEERLFSQRILVSLSITVEDKNTRDDIEKTVDYAQVLTVLDELLSNREVRLVEKVLDLTGETLLASFQAMRELTVSVEKTRFPQGFQQGAGVCLEKKFFQKGSRPCYS